MVWLVIWCYIIHVLQIPRTFVFLKDLLCCNCCEYYVAAGNFNTSSAPVKSPHFMSCKRYPGGLHHNENT